MLLMDEPTNDNPGLQLPAFVRCRHDAPVEDRFPVASDGMHYPTFCMATQKVVYRFDAPETVAADWAPLRFKRGKGGKYRITQDEQLPLPLLAA